MAHHIIQNLRNPWSFLEIGTGCGQHFYFHKKHYGYLTAIIKILPKLSSSLIKFIIFLITFQKYKSEIYKHRLSGIINSVLLKKSWYRPKL